MQIRTHKLGVDAPLAARTAAAIAGGQRPRRLGWWYMTQYVLHGMKAYGATLLVGGIGSPILYLLGLGLGLAAVIPVSVAEGANGPVSYVAFVAPALLVTAAVSVTSEEFTFPVMAGFKWRNTFWAINASPLQPRQMVGGLILAVTFRMLFITGVYYLVMLIFGVVEQPLVGAIMILTGVLAGLAFGLPLLAFAASIKQETGQFALVQRFIFTPLFLFSGTFYPLATLPDWLQPIGWVSPVWHGAELGRVLSYGAPMSLSLVFAHLAVLLAMAGVGGYLAAKYFVGRLR